MAKYIFQYSSIRQCLQAVLSVIVLFTMNNIAYAQQQKEPLVRISEIEIHPQYLEEYKSILKEEAEASVRLEKALLPSFRCFKRTTPYRYGF